MKSQHDMAVMAASSLRDKAKYEGALTAEEFFGKCFDSGFMVDPHSVPYLGPNVTAFDVCVHNNDPDNFQAWEFHITVKARDASEQTVYQEMRKRLTDAKQLDTI